MLYVLLAACWPKSTRKSYLCPL